MRLLNALLALVAYAILAGCASGPPPLQTALPSAPTPSAALGKSTQVTTSNHMLQPLAGEGTVMYFQNQGGGGLALGLLLGPLGVAANISGIESVTKADVARIQGRIQLRPDQAFLQAAGATGFQVQGSGGQAAIQVTPHVLVSKNTDLSISISSSLLFEGSDSTGKWTRRYQYELDQKYSLDAIAAFGDAQSADIQRASTDAFVALLRHIQQEATLAPGSEARISFKSPYISPRFDFEMAGSLIGSKDGRTWVRSMMGVFAVLPADIQVQMQR